MLNCKCLKFMLKFEPTENPFFSKKMIFDSFSRSIPNSQSFNILFTIFYVKRYTKQKKIQCSSTIEIYTNLCLQIGFLLRWNLPWGDSRCALKFQSHSSIDKKDMRVSRLFKKKSEFVKAISRTVRDSALIFVPVDWA